MLTKKNSVLTNAYYVRLQFYQDDKIYNLVIRGCLFICKIKKCPITHDKRILSDDETIKTAFRRTERDDIPLIISKSIWRLRNCKLPCFCYFVFIYSFQGFEFLGLLLQVGEPRPASHECNTLFYHSLTTDLTPPLKQGSRICTALCNSHPF